MKNPFSLSGRTVVVTGGGTGIGLAIAKAMAASGAKVIITGRRLEVLTTAAASIGPQVIPFQADVSDMEAAASTWKAIEAAQGPVDCLVNNAGLNMKKAALDVTNEEFVRIIQTNVNGLFAWSREAARAMATRKAGCILNITSMAAIYGIPKVPAYTAAKTGVLGLTHTLASEWGALGIRVNAIAPGFIFSEMSARALDADPERKQKALGRTPMARMGQAEEVAWAAVFLCSDAASYINGVNLPVDGGNSIGF